MSTTPFYDRVPVGGIFHTDEDSAAESACAATIEDAWHCKLHKYAKFDPMDYWVERDGRLVGMLEMKIRSHASDTYSTVYLSFRKYMALMLARSSDVAGLFVVRFTDGIYWIDVAKVNPRNHTVAGVNTAKARHDDFNAREPMILVPVLYMSPLKEKA